MKEVEKYKALLVMVTGMVVLYFVFKQLDRLEAYRVGFLYVAGGVGVLSLMIPTLGDLIVKGWFKLAELLGWINSRILLSLIFFVILFPLAMASRMRQKDQLRLKKDGKHSLFTDRDHLYTPKDLENIW